MRHAVMAVVGPNVAAGHMVHDDEAIVAVKLPGEHGMQPPFAEYMPRPQTAGPGVGVGDVVGVVEPPHNDWPTTVLPAHARHAVMAVLGPKVAAGHMEHAVVAGRAL